MNKNSVNLGQYIIADMLSNMSLYRLFDIILIIFNVYFETLLYIFKVYRTVMHSLTFAMSQILTIL